ncbi:uncharacterized protein LOC144753631 [Lissotriton helveticus]
MESDSQEDSGSVSDSRKTSIEEHTEDRMTFIISEVDELNEQSEGSGDSDSDDSFEDQLVNSSTELSILERLGLNRVSLTEQDVEAAFAHLSLAFRCDSFTLRRRVQVEERARDVAEENIQQELEECRSLLQRLTNSCMEERWKEMAGQLQESLTVLTSSIERVTKAAEVLGAVHQEARMSRAAEVMIQHVENLKRLHSREHAELEDMKRLIQQNSRNRQLAEIRDDGELKSKTHLMRAFQQASARRRVSIAVIPKQFQPFSSPESGRSSDSDMPKQAAENGSSMERRSRYSQEDSTEVYFPFRSDSASSRRSLQMTDSVEIEGDSSNLIEGMENEQLRKESGVKILSLELSPESDTEEQARKSEAQEQLCNMSEETVGEPCMSRFRSSGYSYVLIWVVLMLISCLVLLRVLELRDIQEPKTDTER